MMSSEDDPADWFRFGAERLQAADIIYRVQGATSTGVELLHEAVERYMKGWLIGRGWKLERTHDLGKLAQAALGHSAEFQPFLDFADDLTQRFWAQHYPGGDLTDVRADYEALRRTAGDLIDLIVKLATRKDSK